MATVVLAGAGATLAEALPRRPRRARRPPLDATFFDLCRHARLSGRGAVASYMERQFGIDPFAGYTMEAVFNFMYSDVFAYRRPRGALDAYWALLKMYSAAIARTTNRLDGTSRKGPGALLRLLWTTDQEITFVTFNQDLVIEKAIEGATNTIAYSSIPWNILTCYGRDFAGFVYPSRGVMFRTRGDSGETDPSLQIHKLHGSLNWVWRTDTLDDAKNSIPRPGREIYCLTGQDVEGDLELEDDVPERFLLPAVVPPTYEKGPQYRDFLGPIWMAARRAIERADRLVVFGYSFPQNDFAARSLLRTASHRGRRLRDVAVIDVNPQVASNLAELLDLRACAYFRDVLSFDIAIRRHN